MIDVSKGRYWDRPWQLTGGCSPISPGCLHCWSAAGAYIRQHQKSEKIHKQYEGLTFLRDGVATFNGTVRTFSERLTIPLKRRKPTVYSIWNDLFHEAVSDSVQYEAYKVMIQAKQHTFLVLTKRPEIMAHFFSPETCFTIPPMLNIWHGLTVCNQQEADAKVPVFLQVPGKKFLSIEPMLGPVDVEKYLIHFGCRRCVYNDSLAGCNRRGGFQCSDYKSALPPGRIDAVILGGETGPGARPLHPDWVRIGPRPMRGGRGSVLL